MYANLKAKNEGLVKRLFLSKRGKIKKILANKRKKQKSEICNSYGEYFKSFLTTSTIHGLIYLSDSKKHPVEILVWLAFVIAGIYGSVSISLTTWNRYQENPTVISMEQDRYNWNTSLPAVTICRDIKLSERKLQQYIDESREENKTLLREFIISLSKATYKTFGDVVLYDGIPSEQYMKLLIALQLESKPSLSNFGANAYQYLLQQTITELGLCYTFNSKLSVYNSPSYMEAGTWKILPENATYKVHPLDGVVFVDIVNISAGYNVFIHGPYEVIDIATKHIFSPDGFFLQIYLTALTLFTSQRARGLTVEQRKCRFHDESDLPHSPVYSYRLCKMECRIRRSKELCGCTPHFYRHLSGDKTCDVKGMHCLVQYEEELITLKKSCKCLPNCDEVNYVVEDIVSREWFLGSNLQFGLKEYPRMRLKRDVLFGFTDFLVYVGGMAGLFLGCSVLSFIEIFYFFTIRLFWFTIKYANETRRNLK